MGRSRLLLIEDQTIFRAALKLLLAAAPELEVVAEASCASEAYACFEREELDLIVIDLMLPGSSGLTVLREAKRRGVRARSLVLSAHGEADMVAEAIAAGASGYVAKDAEPEELFEALRTVSHGGRYFPPSVPSDRHATSPRAKLSLREREVFELLIQGSNNKEISRRLFVSPKTVETHRSHIFEKLNVHSICELMRLASRHHLLTDGPPRAHSFAG